MSIDRPSRVEIRDQDAIRVFTHEPSLRLLMQFAARPMTVSQVARSSGRSIAFVFYHVTRFLDCGLLFLASEERRKGRAVRYYQTAAKAFFVPADALDRPSTRGMAEELRELLDDAVEDLAFEGVVFSADIGGDVVMSGMTASRRPLPPVAEIWHTLRLSDDVAAELTRDLEELLARYARGGGSGREFLIHAALAPRKPR